MSPVPQAGQGRRPLRFLVVGGGAAGLLLVLTYAFVRAGAPAFAAGVGAYAISFVTAYLLQRNWTFGGAASHRRALPRYLILQAGCALISGGLTHLLKVSLGWSPLAASLVMTGLVAIISYFGSSLWAFADERG